ncbi:MAG TPA: hypothetical protein VF483_08970 [Gemmatimonadaceae bacterium]
MNRISRLLMVASALGTGVSSNAIAQRPDSSRAVAATPDSGYAPEIKPPISPRRAFLTSLLLPGYGQSALGRKRSGAMILAMEALAVVMVRESTLGVREARRNAADSIIVSYVDATGASAVRYERTGFPTALIKARKSHLEDWVAVLIANHLFAGTDALVAAMLWDLPAEVAVDGGRRSASVGLRLRF